MASFTFSFIACSLLLSIALASPDPSRRSLDGTVAFATVGRANYAFDIFSLSVADISNSRLFESKLTDGESVNYNGHFVTGAAKQAVLDSFKDELGGVRREREAVGDILAYVSERQGRANLFFNIFFANDVGEEDEPLTEKGTDRPSVTEFQKVEVEAFQNEAQPFLRDRPSVTESSVIYVSTQQQAQASRNSWAAVYSTDHFTGVTKRLTPPQGVADYSPAVSPSGEWVVVASDQGRGWHGEIHELSTDLYIFKAKDGSNRSLLIEHGGWPSWSDGFTLFFHRQAEDGWWSVYKAILSHTLKPLTIERVTPSGIHAFTPAASPSGEWVAVATRRPESKHRHIEIYNLQSKTFHRLTQRIAPTTHHYNPFVSLDSKLLGYHKCRGGEHNALFSEANLLETVLTRGQRDVVETDDAHAIGNNFSINIPHLEHIQSPLPQLSLVRVDGTFPTFSPDGSLIAYIPDLSLAGVYVMRLDGSGRRKIFSGRAFGTAWDWKREGVVYTSSGRSFTKEAATVHIVAIFNVHKIASGEDVPLSWQVLTKEGTANNAFPSPSPDGRFVVFRSGRSGYKNLYIMDAVIGEEGGLWRLTEGPWTDTMCSWSPDGQWIAFASDRENPGGGSFALYLIHPNGTGLHKTFNSSTGGRANHPTFSPDSQTLLFTTDYAGISAEPISVPHQYQPYGEIFLSKLDGSDLHRLTHNAYEDGTPSWGRKYIGASNLSTEGEGFGCLFDDDRWLKSVGDSMKGVSC